MVTDTIQAWQVEVNDLITLGGDEVFTVVDFDDNDGLQLMLQNEDGERECFMFSFFEDITLVVSLDEELPFDVESSS